RANEVKDFRARLFYRPGQLLFSFGRGRVGRGDGEVRVRRLPARHRPARIDPKRRSRGALIPRPFPMETVLHTVLAMVALVLTGYVVAIRRVIPPEGINGIGAFVYYLAIPALIFRTIAGGSHAANLDLGIVFAYFGGAYSSFALAYLFGRFI